MDLSHGGGTFVQFYRGIFADVRISPGPVNPRLWFHPIEVPFSTVAFWERALLGTVDTWLVLSWHGARVEISARASEHHGQEVLGAITSPKHSMQHADESCVEEDWRN